MAPEDMTIEWAETVLDDLRTIVEGIGETSPGYAATFIRESGRSLGRMARLGRIVPEMENPDIREIVARDYRLIYRRCPGGAVILAVLPTGGNLAALWRRVSEY